MKGNSVLCPDHLASKRQANGGAKTVETYLNFRARTAIDPMGVAMRLEVGDLYLQGRFKDRLIYLDLRKACLY